MVFVVGMALLVRGADTSGIRWDDDPEAMRSLKMGLVWLLLNITFYGGS